uniref:Uncharacterized protein n=1 Tax=Timema poppense TaxID=170557 RepID=A0A7R9D6H2_TIMPO|nr:unnamed protein product [Timema poppensis]
MHASKERQLFITASGQDELRVWVEREAVHLSCVSIHSVRWLTSVVAASVPDHKLLVSQVTEKKIMMDLKVALRKKDKDV